MCSGVRCVYVYIVCSVYGMRCVCVYVCLLFYVLATSMIISGCVPTCGHIRKGTTCDVRTCGDFIVLHHQTVL